MLRNVFIGEGMHVVVAERRLLASNALDAKPFPKWAVNIKLNFMGSVNLFKAHGGSRQQAIQQMH